MPCYSPISIRNKRKSFVELGIDTLYRQVPCGHCLGCLKVKQMQLAFRMEWEAVDPDIKCIRFCTFTYAPEFLPSDNELSIDEVQHYVRRLKKFLPEGVKMKYVFCGEHGELYGRAHYHANLFFTDFVPDSVIAKAWKKGIVDIREPSLQRFGYVAKYSVKQLGDNSDNWLQQPFVLISNSLGFYFLEKHGDFIRKNYINSWLNASGYPVLLPRIYMERLFPPFDKIHLEKARSNPAANVYYKSFVGNKVVLNLKRKTSYDARVTIQAIKKGLGISAFEGFSLLGNSFANQNKQHAILSRVKYETGRY